MSCPLSVALEGVMASRAKRTIPVPEDYPHNSSLSGPDLFSNDYLSLTRNTALRQSALKLLSETPLILGSGGSRWLAGNTFAHIAFEKRMSEFFGAPSALLCNSGYDANVAFWRSIPQEGDAIVFDELIHASTRDGMSECRAKEAIYPFSHNSVASFRERLLHVLSKHPAIAARQATVFIAIEALYSMDGDFAPLQDIVDAVNDLIPVGCAHLVVDEAHSTGLYGEGGRGLVSATGLVGRIDTVLHTFGKARAASGGERLTSPRWSEKFTDIEVYCSCYPNFACDQKIPDQLCPPTDLHHFSLWLIFMHSECFF